MPQRRRPLRRGAMPVVAGRYGPNAAWIRLIRELWMRWGVYRVCRSDLRTARYSEPAVHDYRVAAQRLMAGLRTAERLVADPAVTRLRKQARKRFRGLRRLRDVQVMILALPTPRPQARLIWHMRRRLQTEEANLCKGLLRHKGAHRDAEEAAGMRRVLHVLIVRARSSSDAALTRDLRRDLAEAQHEVQGRIQGLVIEELATLHALRIALKRARYKLELVAVSHALATAQAACRSAQGWQDLLGGIRDLQVLDEELNEIRPRSAADETELRVFRARLQQHLTEGVRTLLRQRKQLAHFGTTLQCLDPAPHLATEACPQATAP